MSITPGTTHRVSVVIPSFNRAHLLERSIHSVIAQTYPVSEIIVVDDGSTDETETILRRFSGVRRVYQQNAGAGSARCRGIREARGDWIALLDSDDEWSPQKLARQIAILHENPRVKWCSSNYSLSYPGGRSETVHRLSRDDRHLLATSSVFHFFVPNVREWLMHTSGMLIHRSVFHEIGEFTTDVRYGDDTEMWFRIAFRYPSFGYCPDASFCVHVGLADGLSGRMSLRKDLLPVFERILSDGRTQTPVVQGMIRRWVGYHALVSYLRLSLDSASPQCGSAPAWHRWVPPWQRWIGTVLRMLPGRVARSLFHRVYDLIRFAERRG